MIRNFLLIELKRTLLPGIACGAAAAILLASSENWLRRFLSVPAQAPAILDGMVVFVLAIVAASGGVAAFSKPFREGPLRLVENLPIARHRIWSVRLLVCLLTVLSIVALLLAARPSLLLSDPAMMEITIPVGFLLFTSGACLSLLAPVSTVGGMLAVLLVNTPIVVFLEILNHFIAHGNTNSSASFLVDPLAWGTALVVLCGLNLGLSFRLFMRGEFAVPRRQQTNVAVALLSIFGTLAALVVGADFGVFAYHEKWTEARPDRSAQMSPDGRHLSLMLGKRRHSPITKIVVVDIETGAIVKTFRQNSLVDQLWRKDGTLIALSEGSILGKLSGFGMGTVRLTQVFPEERELYRQGRSNLVNTYSIRLPRMILNTRAPVRRWEGVTSLVAWDGAATEKAVAPWSSQARQPGLYSVDSGMIFSTFTNPPRSWFIGDDGRFRDVTFRLGPRGFSSLEQMNSAREKLTGPQGRQGAYIWSHLDFDFDASSWLYFLEANLTSSSGRLLARREADQDWKEALPGFALTDAQIRLLKRPAGSFLGSDLFGLWTGARNGLAVRAYTSAGSPRLLLADLGTGERFDYAVTEPIPTGYTLGVTVQSFGSDTHYISPVLRRGTDTIRYLRPIPYRSGQGLPGKPGDAPKRSTGPAYLFANDRGFRIRRFSGALTSVGPDGTERRLWPQ